MSEIFYSKHFKTKEPEQGPFTGPIEAVRPGDILGFDRIEEYRAYMIKAHGFDPGRPTGFFERLQPDTGRRPFAPSAQAQTAPEPNPFD